MGQLDLSSVQLTVNDLARRRIRASRSLHADSHPRLFNDASSIFIVLYPAAAVVVPHALSPGDGEGLVFCVMGMAKDHRLDFQRVQPMATEWHIVPSKHAWDFVPELILGLAMPGLPQMQDRFKRSRHGGPRLLDGFDYLRRRQFFQSLLSLLNILRAGFVFNDSFASGSLICDDLLVM